MSLLSVFQWLAATPVGILIRDSTWGFAIVETVHLLALALLGGVVLVVDLRLLGLGLRRQAVPDLVRELSPWFRGTLLAMVLSGFVLVAGEAMKCFYNPAFRWKMWLLGIAIVVQLAIHARLAEHRAPTLSVGVRFGAVLSLTLWLGVGIAGRAIGLI